MVMEEDIRDIVIRTDETLKNLKTDFERHEKEGNQKYDKLLEHSMTCVESGHIKEQNSKIDKILSMLHKLQSRKGKIEISDIVKSVLIIATIVGITFGVMSYFNKVHSEEQAKHYFITEIEKQKCNTAEDVKKVVKIFNDYIVSKNLKFEFECNNPEDTEPVLECYTSICREHCLRDIEKLRWILIAISMDWNTYTGNKEVNMYDLDKILIYKVDTDGEFCLIGQQI
jgi:hypothetical protein|tara:strand:+ start:251 stop:931 length:681 start_codon:yes stop_codon:yes gene_type:complete